MSEVIELLDKNVVSLYECRDCGMVSDLYFNKQLKCTYFSTNKNMLKHIIPTKDIVNSTDSVLIKNTSNTNLAISMELELSKLFTFKDLVVYNTDGKYLGKVQNIFLDDKNYILELILDSNQKITKSDIFNISKDLLIIKGQDCNISKSKYRPRKIPKPDPKHEKISVTILKEPAIQKTNNPQQLNNSTFVSDTTMLLNREITENIIATNGELIARKSSKITKETIKKARIFGKLYELIKYSK